MTDAAWADRTISRFSTRHGEAALRLAQLASLATQIDAPLLRRLRQSLVPYADPGVEADVWFSALVQSHDAESCVLHDSVALRLREQVPNDLRARAYLLTKEAHRHWPAAVQLEEELTALAYASNLEPAQIEATLRPALRALAGSDEPRALEVARWAVKASRRFHPRLLEANATRLLLVAAALRLRHQRLPAAVRGAELSAQSVAWLAPVPDASQRVPLGVLLYEDRVRIVAPESGAAQITLPRTTPLLLSIAWRADGARRERLIDVGSETDVTGLEGATSIEITALDGARYALERTAAETAVATAPNPVDAGPPSAEPSSRWLLLAPRPKPRPPAVTHDVFIGYGDWQCALLLRNTLNEVHFEVRLGEWKLGEEETRHALSTSTSVILVDEIPSSDTAGVGAQGIGERLVTHPPVADRIVVTVFKPGYPVQDSPLEQALVRLDFSDYPDGPDGPELLELLSYLVGAPPSEAAKAEMERVRAARAAFRERLAEARTAHARAVLVELAHTARSDFTTAGDEARLIAGLLEAGAAQLALEIAQAARRRYRSGLRLTQLEASAQLRLGDFEAAIALLQGRYTQSLDRHPETLRLLAEAWLQRFRSDGKLTSIQQAADLFAEGFTRWQAVELGVRAALTAKLAGRNSPASASEANDAESLAHAVLELIGPQTGNDFWQTLRAAEMRLVLGDQETALLLLRAAARHNMSVDNTVRAMARERLRELCDAVTPTREQQAHLFGALWGGATQSSPVGPEAPSVPFSTTQAGYVFSNFTGTVQGVSTRFRCAPAALDAPTSGLRSRHGAALKAILAHCLSSDLPLRAVGAGWSSTRVIEPGDALLDLAHLKLVQRLQPDQIHGQYASTRGTSGYVPVFVQAGTRFQELSQRLEELELAPRTTLASDGASLAGAIATGSHGSALEVGAVHDSVLAVHLVVDTNRALLIQRSAAPACNERLAQWLGAELGIPTELVQDDELFAAAQVGLGALGIVHGVVLETEPRYALEGERQAHSTYHAPVWDLLGSWSPERLFKGRSQLPQHLELVFHPYPPSDRPGAFVTALWKTLPTTLHSRSTHEPFEIASSFSENAHASNFESFSHGLSDTLEHSYSAGPVLPILPQVVFGRSAAHAGVLTNTEIAVSASEARLALESLFNILEEQRELGALLQGAIGVRFAPRTGALLGMNIHEQTCFIELPSRRSDAVHAIYRAYWRRLEAAQIQFTCHWGHAHELTPALVVRYFGDRIQRWKAARRQLLTARARRIFASPLLNRLGIYD